MRPHASQPDSVLLTQLQAQVNVLALQLEAVGKQLALASQVAIDEQSRAQVLFQLTTEAETSMVCSLQWAGNSACKGPLCSAANAAVFKYCTCALDAGI